MNIYRINLLKILDEKYMLKFNKIQTKLDSKRIGGKKAKKLIYSYLSELNEGTKIGDRNFTSQFLCDMGKGIEIIEVFKGEKGDKVFSFSFNER